MKRSIVLSLICCSLFFCSKAQKNNMELGFQSGVNLSSPYGDNISKEQTGILAGLHIGGHVKINITSHFGVKAILAYDQIGASYSPLMLENSTGTGIVKGKLVSKLNYLNLPLLAEYSFGNKVKFNVNAGAFAGLLLKYTLITKTEEPGVSANRTSPDTRKSTNFGASAGAGIQLPITSSMKLDLGIQDNLGLSNTYNDGGTTKINSIAFTGGLTFVIK